MTLSIKRLNNDTQHNDTKNIDIIVILSIKTFIIIDLIVILRIITLSIIDITLILRKMTRGIAIKCHYAEGCGSQNVDKLAPRMYHEKNLETNFNILVRVLL